MLGRPLCESVETDRAIFGEGRPLAAVSNVSGLDLTAGELNDCWSDFTRAGPQAPALALPKCLCPWAATTLAFALNSCLLSV
jgi:hypothetical protein